MRDTRLYRNTLRSLFYLAPWILLLVFLQGCAAPKSAETRPAGVADFEAAIAPEASALLQARQGMVFLDNDKVFQKKIELVKNSRHSLDLAYYIYADDYSSSVFSQELIRAAQRGVRVRILVDYHTNYPRLDLFRMLEQEGNGGKGSLEVRFFNRPTNVIIKDAVYMTLGCGAVEAPNDFKRCSEAKLQAIDKWLQQAIDQQPAPPIPTNVNSGPSGVFLSGLYARDMELLAYSVMHGQDIQLSKGAGSPRSASTSREQKEKKLRTALTAAKIYWQSRRTNERVLERTAARLKLSLAFLIHGEKLRPLYDTLTAYLPVGKRPDAREAIRDWDYLTEFLHHKLLIADDQQVVLGGRNMEDSYHMSTNPLVEKYIFKDTDVHLDLAAPSDDMKRSFERLWDYRVMTATLQDILQHAPNDYLVASQRSQKECSDGKLSMEAGSVEACRERLFARYFDPALRLAAQKQQMDSRAEIFRSSYQPPQNAASKPLIPLDESARIFYLENLPFLDNPSEGQPSQRAYGATNGSEGLSGKHIHEVWLKGLAQACRDAVAGGPREVVLHNAYFFPPSNLLGQLAEMVDGTLDCKNVQIIALTNSPATTDLGVINLAAHYSLKAFGEYYAEKRDLRRGATFQYYEYLPEKDARGRSLYSLHSKVSVLGDRVIIGSANADVRSYMMDTNNGVLIENAPLFIEDYVARVRQILSDPGKTVNRTEDLTSRSLEQLLASDRDAIRRLIAQVGGEGLKEKLPEAPLVEFMEGALQGLYTMTREFLDNPNRENATGNRLNSYFKLL